MKKETASTDGMLYNEDLEGYYSVKPNVVKITETAGQKKTTFTTPILFNGEKPKCDGYFKVVDGKKYLYVSCQEKKGFVPAEALNKL